MTSKPDDIPLDVWKAAVAAIEAADTAYGESMANPSVSEEDMDAASIAVIARAFIAVAEAEREACAVVADVTAKALLSLYEGDGAAGARDAAFAIRKVRGA